MIAALGNSPQATDLADVEDVSAQRFANPCRKHIRAARQYRERLFSQRSERYRKLSRTQVQTHCTLVFSGHRRSHVESYVYEYSNTSYPRGCQVSSQPDGQAAGEKPFSPCPSAASVSAS